MPQSDLLKATVRTKLDRLRQSLRARLAAEGAAWIVLALVALVLATLGVDYMLRLERPVRIGMMAIALAGVAYVLWRQLVWPLRAPMDSASLALLVERKWSQLGDRLISAIQFSQQADFAGMSSAMIARMAVEANDLAESVKFDHIVERRNLKRMCMTAAAAIMLLAGFTVWKTPIMGLWFQRNVLMAETPWPQDTYLTIDGAACDPRMDDSGNFSVMRGESLKIVIAAEPGCVAPSFVVVHADYPSIGPTEERADAGSDGRSYAQVFKEVSEPFSFYVTGGDDSRDRKHKHQVTLIDPPALRDVQFNIAYPEYMHNDPSGYKPFTGLLAAPAGSTISIRATSNKDLRSASLVLDDKELASVEPKRVEVLEEQAKIMAPRLVEGSFLLTAPGKGPSRLLRVTLVDSAGFVSRRGQQFLIQIDRDFDPVVDLKVRGLGAMIGPRALIGMQIDVTDDHGAADLKACLEIPARKTPLPKYAVEPGPDGLRGFKTKYVLDLDKIEDEKDASNKPLYERPKAGDTLRVYAEATDRMIKELGGPNQGKSQATEFRVVSEDDLAADFIRRQEDITRDFEEAIRVQENAKGKVSTALGILEAGAISPDVRLNLVDSSRAQGSVGAEVAKASVLLKAVQEEITNNRLKVSENLADTTRDLDALASPIGQVSDVLARLVKMIDSGSAGDTKAFTEQLNNVRDRQDEITRLMRQIRDKMVQSQDRQRLANQVNVLLKVWMQIMTETNALKNQDTRVIFDPTSKPN